jgi:hypothetical protein
MADEQAVPDKRLQQVAMSRALRSKLSVWAPNGTARSPVSCTRKYRAQGTHLREIVLERLLLKDSQHIFRHNGHAAKATASAFAAGKRRDKAGLHSCCSMLALEIWMPKKP